jgi:class 3 adenylate cyclase
MGLSSGMVTLLFTDIEDSIGLWEADGEATPEASARHNRIVGDQIGVADGHAVKTVGKRFVQCSPTRSPRWRRRRPSSGLSVLSRGRSACPSGCAWRCIRAPAWSATATTRSEMQPVSAAFRDRATIARF